VWAKSSKRYPVVADYFYPSDPYELKAMIKSLFGHSWGPGKEPVISETRRKETIGYIAPHAGYVYSGYVAAHTYYSLAGDGVPETIIILGTNHTGLGSLVSVYPGGEWVTPLGSLRVNEELAKLITEYSEIAELDTEAHVEEHSIEVQLPFIQYLYGDRVSILPIVIGLHTIDVARDLANAIKKAVEELGSDVVIIASSDFNHYEPYNITRNKDLKAIEKILALDAEGFRRLIVYEHITVCGPGGIMTLIEYSKLVAPGSCKAELLKYMNSGDVTGDKSHVVGYASIRFYRT